MHVGVAGPDLDMFHLDRAHQSLLCMIRGRLCVTVATAMTVTMVAHTILFMVFIDRQLLNSVSAVSPDEAAGAAYADAEELNFYNDPNGNLKIKSVHKRHIAAKEKLLTNAELELDNKVADRLSGGRQKLAAEINGNRKILGDRLKMSGNSYTENNQYRDIVDQAEQENWITKAFQSVKSNVFGSYRHADLSSNTDQLAIKSISSAKQNNPHNSVHYNSGNIILNSINTHQQQANIPSLAQIGEIANFPANLDYQYSSDSENTEKFRDVPYLNGNSINHLENNNRDHEAGSQSELGDASKPKGIMLLNAEIAEQQKEIRELLAKVHFQEVNIEPNKVDEEWEADDDWNSEHLIVAKPAAKKGPHSKIIAADTTVKLVKVNNLTKDINSDKKTPHYSSHMIASDPKTKATKSKTLGDSRNNRVAAKIERSPPISSAHADSKRNLAETIARGNEEATPLKVTAKSVINSVHSKMGDNRQSGKTAYSDNINTNEKTNSRYQLRQQESYSQKNQQQRTNFEPKRAKHSVKLNGINAIGYKKEVIRDDSSKHRPMAEKQPPFIKTLSFKVNNGGDKKLSVTNKR